MDQVIEKAIESGVIEPVDLAALLQKPGQNRIRLVDGSYVLPGSGQNPAENFQNKRIGNAVFFDIDEIADKNSSLPHMLPSAGQFSEQVSSLGLGNDDFIVVYGQSGMVMGPARVWWMFRVFGHDKVCVLNGGLPAWDAAGLPVSQNAPAPPDPSDFEAKFCPDLVKTLDEVLQASAQSSAVILDARPDGRFHGTTPEPRPGMRSGHIPGSQSTPAGALVDATGKLKTGAELTTIFQPTGFDSGKPVIASCGSGVTACVIALSLYTLGYKNAAVYDGSWSEWGRPDCPAPVDNS